MGSERGALADGKYTLPAVPLSIVRSIDGA
jgi:hypothetical protein